MRFIPLSLLLLIASPLAAQQMGSVNRNAPTASQGIAFTSGSGLSISYKSITWADGKSMGNLERIRDYINKQAVSKPLGSITVKGDDVRLGGKKLAAGSYKMAFTLDEELNWHLGAYGGEQGESHIDWPLKLKESKSSSSRLVITMTAGKDDTQARIRIAFGKNSCSLTAVTGPRQKKAKKN